MAVNVDEVSIIPRGNIGGIWVTVTIEEHYHDTLVVTEHPVEVNAAITDHAYRRPAEVTMSCGWSNSDYDADPAAPLSAISGGTASISDYVASVYTQLLALQQSRAVFALQTSIRKYETMLMTSLQLVRDQKTSQALLCVVSCREVFLVSTQLSTLPPTSVQLYPQNTAQTGYVGPSNLLQASPANGGSLPSNEWTPSFAAGAKPLQ